MNLKNQIIDVEESLDDWNKLNWDNPDPNDYRYYKMLGLALIERIAGYNFYALETARPDPFVHTAVRSFENTFLYYHANYIYALNKNSILHYNFLFSLFSAYCIYYKNFINLENVYSKNIQEFDLKNQSIGGTGTYKYITLNKSFYYSEEDFPEILKGKKLIFGDKLDNYKDFLIGMYQMALKMKWRLITFQYIEYSIGSGISSDSHTSYMTEFNKAYNKAISSFSKITSYGPYGYTNFTCGYSTVTRRIYDDEEGPVFSASVGVYKDFKIKAGRILPFETTVNLYLLNYGLLDASISKKETDIPFLKDYIILYDSKKFSANEEIEFEIESLNKNDLILELPHYKDKDEFSISKTFTYDYILIYDCNNSYKLKAN